RRLLDAAFDLIAHALGIERLARIDDAPHFHQAYQSGKRDLYFGDLRHVGVVVDGARDAATAPATRTFVPAATLRDPLDDAAKAVIVDVPQAERERILFRERRELVHERLDREHVLRSGERAEVRGAQARRFDV